jgi:hypothetical protein
MNKIQYPILFVCISGLTALSCINQKKGGSLKSAPCFDETITHYHNHYDRNGKLRKVEIEEISTFLDEDSKISHKSLEYIYNANGQLTKIETYLENVLLKSLIKVQNFENDYAETIELSGSDTINYEKLIYDKNKNIIERHAKEVNYDETGKPVLQEYSSSYTQYNQFNQEINELYRDFITDMSINYTTAYQEDADTLVEKIYENGYLIKLTKTFFSKNKDTKYVYYFDKNNRLTSTDEYRIKNDEIYLSISINNINNEQIADTTFYESGKEIRNITSDSSFSFETKTQYDDKGNIKEKIYVMRPKSNRQIELP